MNPTPLGDAYPAFATPPRSIARRWRAGASLAALALVATPFVAAPASAAEAADEPVFTGTLAVTGAAVVGSTLTIDQSGGAWAPEPEGFEYSWYRSTDAVLDDADVQIDDADQPTRAVLPADVDLYLIGAVAARSGDVAGLPVGAATAAPVKAGTLTAGTPTVSGTVRVGTKLTAKTGTWTGGTAFAYQWKISGATVATTSTFTPQAGHAGKTLRLVVTGTKAGYAPKTAYSAFSTVAKASFKTTTPKINGTVKVGALVGATTGHFSPTASLTYRWKANGKPIAGATGRTYKIPSRLHGDKLTVTVTGTRTGYTTKSLTSAASVVSKPFGRASAPTISGTVRVGKTLTANRGTWSPTPSAVSYQWRAGGKSIPGATGRTYKLTAKEHGKKISVQIVGRKYAYLPTTRLSGATSTVKWPVGVSTPNVTKHPTRYTSTTPGKTVTLSASATGGTLRYQWQRWTPAKPTWTNMSGQTKSTLRFTASTAHELNQFRVVVTNMAGKDISNRSYMWVQSSLSKPFPANQWFSLWNYNTAVSESVDNFQGYLAANVYVCAAPGYYVSSDISVEFVGNNGHVYPDAGQEMSDHVSWGVDLDSDGCGYFSAYSNAPQSVRVGGRWRVTDWSDGQVYRQYAKYERYSGLAGGPSARTSASGAGELQVGTPAAPAPVTDARGTFTD